MKLGRPTGYDGDNTVKKAENYFADSKEVAGDNIPSMAGLAVYLCISRDTLYKWKDRHPEFADTIKRGEVHQARELINLMTDKERYTAGSIFVAKNILGWADKKDIAIVEHKITAFEVIPDDEDQG